MYHVALGIGVIAVAFSMYRFNKTQQKADPILDSSTVSIEIKNKYAEFKKDFPNGIEDIHISARGPVVGFYYENPIHESLTLSNGWTFLWHDVAKKNTSGLVVIPQSIKKSVVIMIDDIFYTMKINAEENHLPQAA